MQSLNQHIKHKYDQIRQFKHNLIHIKDSLHHTITNQLLFYDILCTAENYNKSVKEIFRSEHQRKLDWIVKKYYPIKPAQSFRNMNPVKDRVTVLDIDPANPISLADNERQLQSLGPQFAVAAKIDDKLLHQVKVDIAKRAYKL